MSFQSVHYERLKQDYRNLMEKHRDTHVKISDLKSALMEAKEVMRHVRSKACVCAECLLLKEQIKKIKEILR